MAATSRGTRGLTRSQRPQDSSIPATVPPVSHEQLSVNLRNNVNRDQRQLRAVKHGAKVITAAYVDKTISKGQSSDDSDKEERFGVGVAEVGYDATKDVLVCSTGHSTHRQLLPCPKPYPCCGVCHLFDVKETDNFSNKPVAFN